MSKLIEDLEREIERLQIENQHLLNTSLEINKYNSQLIENYSIEVETNKALKETINSLFKYIEKHQPLGDQEQIVTIVPRQYHNLHRN